MNRRRSQQGKQEKQGVLTIIKQLDHLYDIYVQKPITSQVNIG